MRYFLLGIVLAAAVAGCTSPATKHATAPVPTRDCASDALGAEFRGGGYGGGSDFGGIWIWNATSRPCILRGRVAFAAHFSDGSLDPAAQINGTVSLSPTTLPAKMTPPPDNADNASYLFAGLMGFERDDPRQPNGLCRTEDEQTPATLTLTVGTALLNVRNLAANAQAKAVYGCHGRVLLEDLTGPSTN